MNLNGKLVVTAVILLVLSVFSYYRSVTRAERFERGQKFLTQLNPDNIQTIQIDKDGETVTLKKGKDAFSVVEKDNYPAKNESVNRFINDMLEIGLEQPVGSGDSLEKELELVDSEAAMNVVLKNESGNEMVRFRVGKSSEGGRGAYIQRMDGDDQTIYLTSRGVFLSSSADSFLDKEILDVAGDEIVSIQGPDWRIAKDGEEGEATLQGIPAGKKASGDVSQVKNALSSMRFDKVFAADDAQVTGLRMGNPVVFTLADETAYTVESATSDEKIYITISGSFAQDKVKEAATIQGELSDEEMKARSEILTRAEDIQKFNQFHGAWVYQMSDHAGKRFTKTKADLLEDEEPEDSESEN